MNTQTTLHVHHLHGCAPQPLALYLKAIGILRLVAEQADPDTRGWWQDEHFCLLTKLDRQALGRFFLEKYSPTPFLSPWNKGSGFYKTGDPGLTPIENSTAPRFQIFRNAIGEARQLLDAIGKADAAIRAIKDRTKTTKAFQSEEQRDVLRNSEAFRRTVASLREELSSSDLRPEKRTQIEEELAQVESLVAEPAGPPTKSQAAALKKQAGYKRLLREADKDFKRLVSVFLGVEDEPSAQETFGPHASCSVLSSHCDSPWGRSAKCCLMRPSAVSMMDQRADVRSQHQAPRRNDALSITSG